MLQMDKLSAEVNLAVGQLANVPVLKTEIATLTATAAAADLVVADLNAKIAAAEAQLVVDQAFIDELVAKLASAIAPKP